MIGNILILVIKYLYLNYIDHVLIGFYSQVFQLEHLLCSFLLSLIFLFLLISSSSLCPFLLPHHLHHLLLTRHLHKLSLLRAQFLNNTLNCMVISNLRELLLFRNHYPNLLFFSIVIKFLLLM